MKLHEIKNVFGSKDRIAKKLGLKPGQLADLTDDELQTILDQIGEHDFEPDTNFDADELAMGIKVEKEHTNSTLVAKLIAKDHLSELPDYYTRLSKMEKKH